MEQIQQLIEILKQTPSMALWGITIYFLFILLKLASWVYALKTTAQFFIKRYFDIREKRIDAETKNLETQVTLAKNTELNKFFDESIYFDKSNLILLFNEIRTTGGRLHMSDLDAAIKLIKKAKEEKKQ